MKRILLLMALIIATITSVSAQSIEFHQSYMTDSENAPYKATRVIGSYFWSNDNETTNLFTWNSFDRNAVNTLLYVEKKLGNSNWYIHPEIRADYFYNGSTDVTYDFKTQLGVAYLIPWNDGPAVYLTPKFTMTYEKYNKWSKPDLQFSINSSYENDNVYYEGYIDTNWFNLERGCDIHDASFSVFTEQKAYYKLSEHFQIGGSLVFSAGKPYEDGKGFAFCQPYLSFRIPFN